jgi:hypothetical protein
VPAPKLDGRREITPLAGKTHVIRKQGDCALNWLASATFSDAIAATDLTDLVGDLTGTIAGVKL